MPARRSRKGRKPFAWIGVIAVAALVGQFFVGGAFAQSPTTGGGNGPTGPSPDCIPCGSGNHYCYPNCGPTPPPPPPPPEYTVTAVVFENYAASQEPAEIEICLPSGSCPSLSNGQSVTLQAGGASYDVYAVNVESSYSPFQWTTNAGSLSSNTGSSVVFTPTADGALALLIGVQTNWAGMVESSQTSGQSFSTVSGQFGIPDPASGSFPPPGQVSYSLWVGIGGLPNTNLWQAGVEINNSGIFPWYEEIGPSCLGCAPVYDSSPFSIEGGQTVEVTVSTSGGVSSFTITNEASGDSWTGSVHFQPYAQSAEWIDEPTPSTYATPEIFFSNLATNGATVGIVAPFEAPSTEGDAPSLMSTYQGAASFYINE